MKKGFSSKMNQVFKSLIHHTKCKNNWFKNEFYIINECNISKFAGIHKPEVPSKTPENLPLFHSFSDGPRRLRK